MSELSRLPDSTLWMFTVNSPDHETPETAVIVAGLTDALSGFTVHRFLPPRTLVFAALPAGALMPWWLIPLVRAVCRCIMYWALRYCPPA